MLKRFSLYVIWAWVPAAALFFPNYWVQIFRARLLPDLPSLIWISGMFAPGAVVYLTIRAGSVLDRTRGEYIRRGVATIAKVFAAEVVSAFLLCIAPAAVGIWLSGYRHQGEQVASVVLLALCMLALSLVGGVIPCILAYIIGMAAGPSLARDSGGQDDSALPQRYWPLSRVVLTIVIITAADMVLLLVYRNIGDLPAVTGAWRWVFFVAELLGVPVLVGNFWACFAALGMLYLPLKLNWWRWCMFFLLLGLAAFGLWCVDSWAFILSMG